MEITRNHYFMFGLIFLLLGLQFRLVDTYELSPEATQFLAKRSGQSESENSLLFNSARMTGARKTIKPPEWLGWLCISIGSVLILHSLALKKPDG